MGTLTHENMLEHFEFVVKLTSSGLWSKEEWSKIVHGAILICDPYIDHDTLMRIVKKIRK